MSPLWAKLRAKIDTRRCALPFGCALLLASCGKPATLEDCERIVSKIAELELRESGVTAPEALAERIGATQQAFREKTHAQCVGKHLSKEALRCIDNAATSLEILETCLN